MQSLSRIGLTLLLVGEMTCLSWGISDPPLVEKPDVYVIEPEVAPPLPLPIPGPSGVKSYTVQVGSYFPIFVKADGKVRTKFTDSSLFLPKFTNPAKVPFAGILYTNKQPSINTWPDQALIFTALKPGTTTLTVDANGTDGPVDKLVATITVVGGGSDPVPPPPVADSFLSAVTFVLTAEPPEERSLLPKLDAFYQESQVLVDSATTWSDLFTKMQAKSTEKGTSGKLVYVQRVISADLKSKLPWKAADVALVMSADDKTKAKAEFAAVSDMLKKLK